MSNFQGTHAVQFDAELKDYEHSLKGLHNLIAGALPRIRA
jgi:hypothetical protein